MSSDSRHCFTGSSRIALAPGDAAPVRASPVLRRLQVLRGQPWGWRGSRAPQAPKRALQVGHTCTSQCQCYPEPSPCLTTLYSSFTLSGSQRYFYVTRPCVSHASESESTMCRLRGCVPSLSGLTLQRGPQRDDKLWALNELLHGIKAGIDGIDVSQRPTHPLPQQPPAPCISTLNLLHITPSLLSSDWKLFSVDFALQNFQAHEQDKDPSHLIRCPHAAAKLQVIGRFQTPMAWTVVADDMEAHMSSRGDAHLLRHSCPGRPGESLRCCQRCSPAALGWSEWAHPGTAPQNMQHKPSPDGTCSTCNQSMSRSIRPAVSTAALVSQAWCLLIDIVQRGTLNDFLLTTLIGYST